MGITTEVNPVQELNEDSGNLVILLEKVISVKPEQPEKAWKPTYVILSGIDILVKPVHFSKAWSPIFVTPSGIVILFSVEQYANPDTLVPPLITTVSILSFGKESIAIVGIVALFMFTQSLNEALLPETILVILLGRVMCVKPTQPLNASDPIAVIRSEKTIFVKPIQFRNA